MLKDGFGHLGTIKLIVLLFCSCIFSAYAVDSGGDQAQMLLDKYQRQQQRIERIQASQNQVSSIEQAALSYRLLERHLSAFDTIDQLSKYLIEQKSLGLATDQTVLAQLEVIIEKNNKELVKAIDKKQLLFNQAYASEEADSVGAFQLYAEHLASSDVIYSAMVQQVNNQQALGFDVDTEKDYLINHLYSRAESFSGMVGLVGKKREELAKLIKITPDDQALKDQLAVVTERLAVAGLSFKLTVDFLTQLGFDSSFYQQTLLKLGGQITTDVLDVNILGGIAKRWVERLTEYFVDHGGEWIFKLILLVGIYYLFRSLSRLVRKLMTKSLDSSKLNLSSLMKDMIISSVARVVIIIGILFALAQVGISLAPILAGLGVAGFIIGFALQDTLGNFAAGMMILIYRPYDVGDMVEVGGGVFGKVKSMNLVSTTILTIDNQTLVIPNSKIWGDVIKNVTAQKLRRVDLIFGIGYSDDIEKTEAVLMELLVNHPLVLNSPEPVVKLHVLNESSVDFIVRPWVKTDDYWDVYWDITREVKMRFDRDGISIPFPQRDVHFYPATAEAAQIEK
ncbi:mechanosensitive ion channel family protein [Agarivorans sp. TSD2052]|uniref:mechanosensitive ion channel family protein n=1 Tax=Agarivorans sp. TSD2052 TaxID=2937286 RepID=UPI002010A5A7|nr:mechanosensitive ion channel family protein [Agarivorans sp. TSD2052]UPW18625.1 mechanosensitive ion channel family protein [Agarivorans sp. TSD2052]